MANNFKKVIAVIASLAILASMTAVPVFAEDEDAAVAEEIAAAENLEIAESTTVVDEDYTAEGASKNSWTPDDNNGAINSNGLLFTNNATGGHRWSVLKLGSAITESSVVEYEVQVKESTNPNPTVISLGAQSAKTNELPTSSIVQLTIDGGAKSGSVNGESFTMTASGTTTPWLHVQHIINAESKEVTTTITTADGDPVYSNTTAYYSSGASLSAFQISLGKNSCTAQLKYLKIATVDAPSIELEDISRIEVGTSAVVATVEGAGEITVELTDSENFSYTIEDGVVSIAAMTAGTETTAKITAIGDVTVSKSITLSAQTADDIVGDVIDSVELSDETVTKNEDDTYTVLGNFTVPVADGAAVINWISDNDAVSVNADGKVNIGSGVSGRITLTATVSYNGSEASKSFTIVIPSNKVFYDLSFDDAATGNLASIDGPGTGEYEGVVANVVTRSGSSNCNYVSIAKDAAVADTNYLAIVTSNYNVSDAGAGNQRRTYLTLSKMEGLTIANTLHINFDLYFTKTTSSLVFTDGTNELSVDANIASGYGELPVEQWYNITIDSFPSSRTATITVKDADGNKLTSYETDTYIKNLTQINTSGKNDIFFYIDNLVVADAIVPVIAQTTDTVILGETDTIATVKDAVDVNVELSNTSAFDANYENGKVTVTAKGSEAASTTVTITADNDGVKAKEVYTVSSLNAADITAAAKAQNTVYYAADKKGQVIKPEIADGATIYNDIVLPSIEKVILNGFTYTADVMWEVVSGKDNLTSDGTISVSDKAAHTAELKKTVSYSKNGEVKATDSVTYGLNVQFDNERVLSDVSKALADAEITGDAAVAYLKAFVYDYQVKLDAAYDANFTAIPSNVYSSITFPTKGYFGSTFTWNSSVPTVISNQGKYTKPTSTKSVVLTASIEAGDSKYDKKFTVSVPGSGSNGGGGGGGSTSSSGTTSKPNSGTSVATSTTTAVAGSTASNAEEIVEKLIEEKEQANDKFVDVKDAVWAREAINTLADKGIINGVSETEFAPNATVTRAQFAKMLMGAFGYTANAYTTSSFKDVSTSDWCFQYVEAAYNLGIINGVEEDVFAPNALITRQDMAVMVSRAAAVSGKTISAVGESKSFADESGIASYAKSAVDELVKGGIINGLSDTEFAPNANATRAQAAKILFGIL